MTDKKMKVTFSKDFPGLGSQIKKHRQASDKPLTQLAAKAGISVPHWNRIENEKIVELPIETLRNVEKALGVDLRVSLSD